MNRRRFFQQLGSFLPVFNRFLAFATVLVIVSFLGLVISQWFTSRDVRQISSQVTDRKALPQKSETRRKSQLTQPLGDTRYSDVLKAVFTEDELATPHARKLIAILESPAYAAFVETKTHRLGDIFDFFQSQGLAVDKNEISEMFQKLAPVGYPDELEQHMREQLSSRLIAANISPQTDAGLIAFQKEIAEFLSEEKNIGWMMTHFQGDYMAFGEWAANILGNLTRHPEENAGGVSSTPPPSSHRTDPSDSSTPALEDTGIDEKPSIEIPHGRLTENEIQIGGEHIEVSTPENTELPSQSVFENALAQQFSPQRFNRAMNILSQYGPEEGIRRLKDSDPEVAEQVARILKKHRRTTE